TFRIGLGAEADKCVEQSAMTGASSCAAAIIDNDDSATLTLGAAPSITETNADQTKVFTLTLDHDVQGGFDVEVTSTDGSADSNEIGRASSREKVTGTVGEW